MPQQTDPLKSFRFLVEVESDGNRVVAAFSHFSGVKMRTQTAQVRTGSDYRGVIDAIPVLTDFENVTLKKGVIGDNEFLDWILAVSPGLTEGPTGKAMCRTVNIAALTDKGERAITWSLLEAMPVAYELDPMDSSQSAVLSETIEFRIGGFKRETHS